METQKRILPPQILLEEYRRLLQEDDRIDALPLVISGGSMSPFLIGGRDTVYLGRVTRPICRGDVLLYQRTNGRYVLHRVYDVTDSGLTMVGDAQTVLEYGIREDQIIAIMTRAVRKGRVLSPVNFLWEFFEKVWIRMIPLRRPICDVYAFVHRLLHRMSAEK